MEAAAECECLPGYKGNPLGNPFTGDGCVKPASDANVSCGITLPGHSSVTLHQVQILLEQFLVRILAYIKLSLKIFKLKYAV